MKYLLNSPFAVAALLQVWFSSLVFMSTPWSGWSDGPSRVEHSALAWPAPVSGSMGLEAASSGEIHAGLVS
jgi:hypothetical protein